MRIKFAPLKITCALLGGLLLFHPWLLWGQDESPVRPQESRPKLPDFESPVDEKILPDIAIPKGFDTKGLSAGAEVSIRAFQLVGNTLLSEEDIKKLTGPYLNRKVSFAQLEQLRDQITTTYIRRGYVNSGALIPSQEIKDGIFVFQVIEGQLTDIDIRTDGRFRKSYFENRLKRYTGKPLNVFDLEQRLQLFQIDERIERFQANLLPGDARGESRLTANVKEANPFKVRLGFDNYQPPSVGSYRGRLTLAHGNVLGFGDRASATYSGSEGLHTIEALYEIPVNAYDTTVDVHFRRGWGEVVEAPFDTLDIDSDSYTIGSTVRHPILRSLRNTFAVFLTGEYRRSETFLLGAPFSFSSGPDSGVSEAAVLRFGQDYLHRDPNQVIAARSTFSFGLDALGATQNAGNVPDGQFFTWLGQLQWAHRLPFLKSQLIFRGDAQLSDSPLLGLEQFVVGGHASVRGYRENELVRDNGTAGSLEIRVPVWQRNNGASFVELLTFADAGHSWNTGRPNTGQKTLLSAGLGARVGFTEDILLQFHWAHQFRDVPEKSEHDLQDSGIHFSLTATFD